MTDRVVPVAAAVVTRPDGRVLLAQRPPGKAYAGYWEFPGGKLEPDETPRRALERELAEELGIRVRCAAPWLVQRFVYPHAHVELHFFRVYEWDGDPVGHDGQAFAWQTPGAFDVEPLLPEYFSENLETKHIGEEVHPGESVEEKISLSERFGLWISFYPFSQDDYLAAVAAWLAAFDVPAARTRHDADARHRDALQFALQRGSRIGRIAWQFARGYAGAAALRKKTGA